MKKLILAVTLIIGPTVGLGLGAALSAFAQEKVLTDVPTPLTASEKKDIEILTLKAQLTSAQRTISDLQGAVGACQAQLGPLQFEQNRETLLSEQKVLKERVEKARPGFVFDPATGKFEKRPDPPPPVKR